MIIIEKINYFVKSTILFASKFLSLLILYTVSGQFLFKKVLPEKIQQKGGKRIVYLLVQGIPIRRTVAIVTSRHNMALNVTRACLKIRDQGREVIDGMYSDYLVPNIRYVSLKELPPL